MSIFLQIKSYLLQNNGPIMIGSGQFACPFCPKIMKFVQNMKRHILTHTGEKPYICSICEQGFIRKSSRDQHIIRVHS